MRERRRAESKRANEMAADTETERKEGEIERRQRRRRKKRPMIVPPAATRGEEGRDGAQPNFGIFNHVSSGALPPFLARSRVQITSLKLRVERKNRIQWHGFLFGVP